MLGDGIGKTDACRQRSGAAQGDVAAGCARCVRPQTEEIKMSNPSKPPRRMFKRGVDLTRKPGNPAFEITQIYEELMDITIPELFVARVRGVVEPMVGAGVSHENYRRLMRNMHNCVENPGIHHDPIVALQDYISRGFLLAASGNKVL